MPTEFVMKHMSHLIEKQLQLVDDSDRSFPITLIQRRTKVRRRRRPQVVAASGKRRSVQGMELWRHIGGRGGVQSSRAAGSKISSSQAAGLGTLRGQRSGAASMAPAGRSLPVSKAVPLPVPLAGQV